MNEFCTHSKLKPVRMQTFFTRWECADCEYWTDEANQPDSAMCQRVIALAARYGVVTLDVDVAMARIEAALSSLATDAMEGKK